MNIILLSGGSGKRLWPLSNEIRSKQFIKIFRKSKASLYNNDDYNNNEMDNQFEYESMVQRVYRQLLDVDPNTYVTVATSKNQVSTIRNQLGMDIGISVEPCRRDTFPAIILASTYLHDVKHIDENEPIVVCPVDPYVEEDYFKSIKDLSDLAFEGNSNIYLMGIKPTYPSEKYGYIIPESSEKISKVLEFKEKPDIQNAKRYISEGGLWNGGIFAFKLGYILKKAHSMIDFSDYEDLYTKYDSLTKISFDYAVVEKEPNISVLRFSGRWMDVGTWNTLSEVMDEKTIGKVIMDDKCDNTNVINELNVPILAMGLKDIIVAASAEGIIVSDKEQSSYIKPYVDSIKQEVMFSEKSWGSYQVIDINKDSMTIKVTLNPGSKMNYHSHKLRDEVWTVVRGEGKTIVDGMEQSVKAGDVITIASGCKHTIISNTKLVLIEVQIGENIDVNDKQKHYLEI